MAGAKLQVSKPRAEGGLSTKRACSKTKLHLYTLLQSYCCPWQLTMPIAGIQCLDCSSTSIADADRQADLLIESFNGFQFIELF